MVVLGIILAAISMIISTVMYLSALTGGNRPCSIDDAFDYPIFTMCLHCITYFIPGINILTSAYFYNKMVS